MLAIYGFEYTACERSWVNNPGEWWFILRVVPDQEITVKDSIKHLLTGKKIDFERLCLKGKKKKFMIGI